MFKHILSKFNFLKYWLFELLNKPRKIIIYVGRDGTFLAVIDHDEITDKLFVPNEKQNNVQEYQFFLIKYKRSYVYYILDNTQCELYREAIPVLEPTAKKKQVKKFLAEHFSPSDVIAYSTYNQIENIRDIENILIAKSTSQPSLNSMIDYSLENSLRFGGIYFLPLELNTIIDNLLKKTKNSRYINSFNIFVSLTNASSLIIAAKHNQNLISMMSVPCPPDKDATYIQGMIEQAVNDLLISLKNYMEHSKLEICLIFLIDKNLQILLQQSSFSGYKTIYISNQEVLAQSDNFSDPIITWLFAKQKKFPAFNETIKSITHLKKINLIIFKPLLLVITILIIAILNIRIQTFRNQQKNMKINKQYYQIAGEYRKIKQHYPAVGNVTNLVDFYNIESMLQDNSILPFDIITQLLSKLPPNLHIDKIKWRVKDQEYIIMHNPQAKIELYAKLIVSNISIDEAIANLHEQMTKFKESFTILSIEHIEQLNNIIILSNLNTKIVPVKLILEEMKKY